MTSRLTKAAHALSLALPLVLGTAAATFAQNAAPAPDNGALAGPPTPERVQPWGLPPPPPGIGPVSLFADISNTPQGKFLEGGSFDDQGNLWFVAIGSGWISYLSPTASWYRLQLQSTAGDRLRLRAARHPLERRQTLSDNPASRHHRLRSADEKSQFAGQHLPQPVVQRPERSRFRCRRQSVFHRSMGYRPGSEPVDQTGAVYQYSTTACCGASSRQAVSERHRGLTG